MIQITDNQRTLILLAVQTGGRIEQYPDNLKGGARTAVTRSLVHNDLIVAAGAGYALTAAGYEAVGLLPPDSDIDVASGAAASSLGDGARDTEGGNDHAADDGDEAQNAPDSDETGGGDEAGEGEPDATAPPKPRKPTRIDQVVALLTRPQGATIKEVIEATDWQQHSVRGFFAGTLKKKGYTVINEKTDKQERVYRIVVEDTMDANPAAKGGEEE